MAKPKVIDPNELKKNFNVVSTSIDNETEFGQYFLHSKHWTEKILKISFGLILASIVLFSIGVIGFVTRPVPAVYATTEYGSLYELDRFNRDEALKAIEQYSSPNNVENPAANGQNNVNNTAQGPAPIAEPTAPTNPVVNNNSNAPSTNNANQ